MGVAFLQNSFSKSHHPRASDPCRNTKMGRGSKRAYVPPHAMASTRRDRIIRESGNTTWELGNRVEVPRPQLVDSHRGQSLRGGVLNGRIILRSGGAGNEISAVDDKQEDDGTADEVMVISVENFGNGAVQFTLAAGTISDISNAPVFS